MSRAKQSMDGNTAAAHVAYAFTDVAAIYPITPSSPNQETQASHLPESLQNTYIKKACVLPPLSARPWLRP